MAGNIRNAKTIHPRKANRRSRAADRFSIDKERAALDNAHRTRKMQEAKSLGVAA